MLKLISLFDGIGGFPLAWCNVTGQRPEDLRYWSSEIEPWPCDVVRQRFPNVNELGDILQAELPKTDSDCIITFGSPCQDLSAAGKRAGLAGERSGLFHEAIRIVRDIRPKYFIWENVGGAYSSNKGEDLAEVFRSIAEIGYDAAWTELDAQWFGVPQRRRRIYLVGFRDGLPEGSDPLDFVGRSTDECRAQIQSVRESRSGNLAASQETGQEVAGGVTGSPGICSDARTAIDNNGAYILDRLHTQNVDRDEYAIPVSPALQERMGTGGNNVPMTFQPRYARNDRGAPDTVAAPLDSEGGATSDKRQIAMRLAGTTLRRLTPIECLRLQGFPDDWFDGVAKYSDTKAYKAIGNSLAIPCAEWIFRRILEHEKQTTWRTT